MPVRAKIARSALERVVAIQATRTNLPIEVLALASMLFAGTCMLLAVQLLLESMGVAFRPRGFFAF